MRPRLARRGPACVAAGLLGLAGCTAPPAAEANASDPTSTHVDDPDEIAALRAAAGLATCPEAPTGAPTKASGDRLPDLTLDCLGDGPAVDLAALGGVPYVVSIWAGWCTPCREEMPYLQEVYEQAAGRVGVLGVDFQDTPVGGLSAAADFGITFPSVQDLEGATRPELKFVGPPSMAFVSADGEVVEMKIGGVKSAEELRDLIEQYLGVDL